MEVYVMFLGTLPSSPVLLAALLKPILSLSFSVKLNLQESKGADFYHLIRFNLSGQGNVGGEKESDLRTQDLQALKGSLQ